MNTSSSTSRWSHTRGEVRRTRRNLHMNAMLTHMTKPRSRWS